MLLFLVSFLAGILTVLAPCTISLLPVIVGGNIGEGNSKIRSLVVTASLGVSVILFTLLLKVSTVFINIPQTFWQIFSGVIIFILGLIMIFPSIWEKFSFVNKVNLESNRLLAVGYQKKNIIGDVIMGAALGPVFSTCSPTYFLILATVLPKSFGAGIIYLLAYVVGLCGFLLIISILSQKAIEKLGFVSDNRGWIKRTVGVIFLILGVAIISGLDQKFELAVSGKIFDVTKIEQNLLTKQAPQNNNPVNNNVTKSTSLNSPRPASSQVLIETDRVKLKSSEYTLAPEITDPSGFINTDGQPVTLAQFKGKKVVLVDFWTYSCINCQRTIPYLNAWYQKYAREGLEIVGIHTPEFSFEKVQSNVETAVKSDGINYPVVMDNDYGTWNAFGNSYWPREYLIDLDGFVVHDHAGEGDYDGTEQAIQKALAERASILGQGKVSSGVVAPAGAISMDPNQVSSPETYFGSNRNEYLANGNKGVDGTQTLNIPDTILENNLYLGGVWNFTSEYAETTGEADATVVFKYDAKNVYMVASSVEGTDVEVYLDGKLNNTVHVQDEKLYQLINGTDYGEHTLKLLIGKPGIKAYTFTFG